MNNTIQITIRTYCLINCPFGSIVIIFIGFKCRHYLYITLFYLYYPIISFYNNKQLTGLQVMLIFCLLFLNKNSFSLFQEIRLIRCQSHCKYICFVCVDYELTDRLSSTSKQICNATSLYPFPGKDKIFKSIFLQKLTNFCRVGTS